jgi:HSP20 family protein
MSTLTRYEPVSVLNDINRLFEQTFFPQSSRNAVGNSADHSSLETSQWIPAVDVKEGKHSFQLKVDLPGIDKKDINISMERGILSIQGERSEEKKEEGDNYYRVERISGKFYRQFALPETADSEKIQANLNKGVLEVIIPKKEIAKPKSIEIKSED